jgi:death-on-curing protein
VTEPRWLTAEQIKVVHERQLARFGGPAGIRDEGAPESALSRPVNRWHYEAMDLPELAAAYAYGLARNHAFIDGNKRVAFLAMLLFLRRNGVPFAPDQAQATAVMLGLAAGEIDETGLTRWIRDNWPEVPAP